MHAKTACPLLKIQEDFKQIPVHKMFRKSLDCMRFHHIKTVPSRSYFFIVIIP